MHYTRVDLSKGGIEIYTRIQILYTRLVYGEGAARHGGMREGGRQRGGRAKIEWRSKKRRERRDNINASKGCV